MRSQGGSASTDIGGPDESRYHETAMDVLPDRPRQQDARNPISAFETLVAILPEAQREIVTMLKVGGLTLEEVADCNVIYGRRREAESIPCLRAAPQGRCWEKGQRSCAMNCHEADTALSEESPLLIQAQEHVRTCDCCRELRSVLDTREPANSPSTRDSPQDRSRYCKGPTASAPDGSVALLCWSFGCHIGLQRRH